MFTEIEKNGNIGKVFLEKEAIESETYKQIVHMIGDESINNARVMPDCHKSKNCCVGFTSQIINKIVPNFVGVDIGCGIVSYPLQTEKKLRDWREKKLIKFTQEIQESINKSKMEEGMVGINHLDRIFDLSNKDILPFASYYKEKLGVDIQDKIPIYDEKWLENFLSRIKSSYGELERALGTLGGGNHFIEFERSDNTGIEYLTVHSGSRIIGKKICEHHQKKINAQNETDWTYFDEEVAKFNKANKDKKARKEFRDLLRENIKKKNKKKYLDEDDALAYYFDMIFGQKFAIVNREVIMTYILSKLDLSFDPSLKIESIHNYIDFSDLIMRKGAIRAHQGENCLIALNMRDGILLCEGKGNEDWNYSSAHGSGREITRQKALKNSQTIARRLEKQLAKHDVISVCSLSKIADEAPECYKETNFIRDRIKDSVIIKEQLKPFINIKQES